MRVLLVNIYFHSERVRYMSSSYVLKAFYEANGLHSVDVDIDVHNYSTLTEAEALADELLRRNADMIGFSCYTWNISLATEVAKRMRAAGCRATLVMGGPEISEQMAESELLRVVDFFAIGEGEIVITQLIDRLYEGAHSEVPHGLLHYDPKARAAAYRPQTQRVDLEKVPSIYTTETIPLELYDEQLVFLETQRGCKYKCHYCIYHKNLRGITSRNIRNVCEEIIFLMTQRHITSIRIVDPTFSANLPYAKDILRCFLGLKAMGHKVKKLMIEYEYHDVDEEYISLISQLRSHPGLDIHNYARPGLTPGKPISDGFEIVEGYTVFSGVGIQSFNNTALAMVGRRPIDDEELNRFFSLSKTYNIMLKLDMILGLPGETRESYLLGLNRLMGYLEGTDHHFQPAVLMVLPGTTLERRSAGLGLCYQPDNRTIFKTAQIDEEAFFYCVKITGIVHRLINSPLRDRFYECVRQSGGQPIDIIVAIYEHILSAPPASEHLLLTCTRGQMYDLIGNALFSAYSQSYLGEVLSAVTLGVAVPHQPAHAVLR